MMIGVTSVGVSSLKSGFRWLLDHKYVTSVLYILFICVVLFLCQIFFENIGSISSLTIEEFGSIVVLNTSSVTYLAVFVSSYFHLNVDHLLSNVGAYVVFSGCVLLVVWGRERLRKKSMPPYYLLLLNALPTLFVPILISGSTVIGWEKMYMISIHEVGFSGIVFSVFGILLVEAALFIGLLAYICLVKPACVKFGFVCPLFLSVGCVFLLWGLWDAVIFIFYNDFIGLFEGEPINFFGHMSGFIMGVILALILEKLPERVGR